MGGNWSSKNRDLCTLFAEGPKAAAGKTRPTADLVTRAPSCHWADGLLYLRTSMQNTHCVKLTNRCVHDH